LRLPGHLIMVHSIQLIFWLTASLVGPGPPAKAVLEAPIVFVQIPTNIEVENRFATADGMLRADYGEGGRLVVLRPDGKTEVLSGGFVSAVDPDVSFDGAKILFSGKHRSSEQWNVFEMRRDGSEQRQITENLGDCRSPIYQSTLYTLVSTEPWYQIAFISDADDEWNEYGSGRSTSIYSCKLDGSETRRLTYNISSDMDPFLMQNGRVLFASWQRSTLAHGLRGRVHLCAVNIDGTDFSLFTAQGKRIRLMPCTTGHDLAIFVESDSLPWDGAGQLASVTMRRPLRSYRELTRPEDGLFHSPSPLPDGTLLVSRRPVDHSGSHGIYRFHPSTGELELIFDDPNFHDIQAKILLPRKEPDGRSSVVAEQDPNGQLYCLNSELTDLEPASKMPKGTVKRLRVLAGVPQRGCSAESHPGGLTSFVEKRLLGEIPVESDGSFFIEVPANTPIQLQTLDDQGMALRTCGWIWVKNHEPRGCIGCHEDGELTPQNQLVKAVRKESYTLTLPENRRRTVGFKQHVAPLVVSKCASASCHGRSEATLKLKADTPVSQLYSALLNSENSMKYVHPGQARTSPLIWHVFGHPTIRTWDRIHPSPIPNVSPAFSAQEKQVLVEWIDMGASWSTRSIGAKGSSGEAR